MDKATLQKRLDELKKPREQLLKEYQEKAKTTFPDEVGLKHPKRDVGVHVRDDGSLELFAGSARIILDSETGAIIILGNHLVTSTADSNMNLSETNSFAVNGIPLSFKWLDYSIQNLLGISRKGIAIKSTGPKGEIPSLCPVTFKEWLGGTEKYLTGSPGAGQHLESFSKIFDSKPLFLAPSDSGFLAALTTIVKGVI